MITTGKVVEVGVLDDGSGDLGVVIQRPNNQRITISGLTMDEMRVAALHLFQAVSVTMDRETPP